MGKGDRKSRRGKIRLGSYGNSRNRKALKLRLKRTASVKATETPAEETEAAAKPRRTARKKAADS